jgi:hypothetical protein
MCEAPASVRVRWVITEGGLTVLVGHLNVKQMLSYSRSLLYFRNRQLWSPTPLIATNSPTPIPALTF